MAEHGWLGVGPAGAVAGIYSAIGPWTVDVDYSLATASYQDFLAFTSTSGSQVGDDDYGPSVTQYYIPSVGGHIVGISGHAQTGTNDAIPSLVTLNAAIARVTATSTIQSFTVTSGGNVFHAPISPPLAFMAGDKIGMQWGSAHIGKFLFIQAHLDVTLGT